MKLLVMVVLFSSMLFGMQKQIILGSYASQSNGFNAVKKAQEQIDNDEKLKTIMKNNSAKVMATQVSDFTVVSVNVFETYSDLLPAMKAFQTYYKDAFSLNYPTKGFLEKENFQMIVKKAKKEEVAVKEAKAVAEVETEEVVKEKETTATKKEVGIVEKLLLAQAAMLEKEMLNEQKKEVVVNKVQNVEEYEEDYSSPQVLERTYTVIEDENSLSQLNYNILIGLVLLVLLIAGGIIYTKVINKVEST